jgi:hypothetical protein
MSEQGTWIYGIVPAGADLVELDRRADKIGVDVWVVELGDLGAIVSDAPSQDARGTRDRALAHARVLEAAIVDAPVVPFRFGVTVQGSDKEVGDELLKARHDELAEMLRRVKDHLQMTVKVEYDEDAILREIVQSNPEISELRQQARRGDEMATRDIRVRLGELVNAGLEQARESDAAQLIQKLERLATAVASEDLESEYMIVHAPCLIERKKSDDFEHALEQMAEDNSGRMRFTLLGPMPAFSFVGSEEPARA